jgi:colanic acid/amylovoran biosynthesis glycosyltransferase
VINTTQPTLIVFCDHLLYPSETFVRAQAQALQRFTPVYAGSRRVPGLDLPPESTFTVSSGDRNGRIREVLFKLFGIAPDLIERLRALDPVLMHAHFGPDGLRALPLARKLGLPLIITFHGSDATATDVRNVGAPFGHRRYLVQRSVVRRGGTLFIAVSEFIRGKLLEQHFAAEKTVVHYIGVDTKLFSPSQGEQDQHTVLFVGRLANRKGAEFLVRAMEDVQKDDPEAELVLIGDGPLRGELERRAKRSLRRCRFLGTQSPQVVREWLDRAAVFCAPSITGRSGEAEAFGMVFAEAQAMEKPVVSFATGGIGEAVLHGETGFLAPDRDWRTLAQYLSWLLKNADLRRKFGVAGRQRVLRLFDLNTQTSALEKIYEGVLETTSASVGERNRPSLYAQQEH